MDNPPNEYLCPISMELMTDPVLCTDGFTYEIANIKNWFDRNPDDVISPKTGLLITDRILIPNTTLLNLIKEYSINHADEDNEDNEDNEEKRSAYLERLHPI